MSSVSSLSCLTSLSSSFACIAEDVQDSKWGFGRWGPGLFGLFHRFGLKRKFWHKGIATETAIISLDYAFTKLNLKEIYAAASIDNLASNKILQKIGMNFIETFKYEEIECNWYKIDSEAYYKIRTANNRFAQAGLRK